MNQERAVELGLLNSREYRWEVENLYLVALALSLERFEFDTQWSLTNSTYYDGLGKSISGRFPRESRLLTARTDLGLTRAFASGGQLLVDFADTFVWEFAGTDSNAAFSNLSVSLVQPILRGAFRDVRLESLTQAERNVLYAVRDYARFRKQFYFAVVSGDDGYLSLLLQLQAIRNLEANLESLRLNLRAHEALATAGIVSLIQVDQVFQSYQAGRLRLIRARNDWETSLDRYKIRLGLPPDLDLKLDNSRLAPFEPNSPEIARLQDEIESVLAGFRELDAAPPAARLQEGFGQMRALQERVSRETEAVAGSPPIGAGGRRVRDSDPGAGLSDRFGPHRLGTGSSRLAGAGQPAGPDEPPGPGRRRLASNPRGRGRPGSRSRRGRRGGHARQRRSDRQGSGPGPRPDRFPGDPNRGQEA